MLELISGAITTMVGIVVAVINTRHRDRQKLIEDFADYLSRLANDLGGVASSLRDRRVPTEEGNRLEKSLEKFAEIQQRLPLTAKQKSEFKGAYDQLLLAVYSADGLDDMLRGNILKSPDDEFNRRVEELERVAGEVGGQASYVNLTVK